MNILHINTMCYGGAATGMFRQHLALQKAGINSKVLAALPPESTMENVFTHDSGSYKTPVHRLANRFGLLRSNFQSENRIITSLGKPYFQGGSFELYSSPFSDYKLHEHPLIKWADIINLHWICGFVDIPSFLERVRKPLVWTLHDMNPYLGGFHYDIDIINNPQLLKLEKRYVRVKKNALKAARYAIIGNSKWNITKAIESQLFGDSILNESIYYPLENNHFSPIEKSVAKRALNLPEDKFLIGFACEDLNNPRKGYGDLIEAINLLPTQLKRKMHCLTFGKIPTNHQTEIGIPETQMGKITNSRLQSIIYSAMEAFILPSKAEAFGLTALEAMACKTPVIGYHTGGIPEMVKNDQTGFLVNNNTIASLSQNIARMVELNQEERSRMGQNALELISTQHNSEKIALQYINVYKSIR